MPDLPRLWVVNDGDFYFHESWDAFSTQEEAEELAAQWNSNLEPHWQGGAISVAEYAPAHEAKILRAALEQAESDLTTVRASLLSARMELAATQIAVTGLTEELEAAVKCAVKNGFDAEEFETIADELTSVAGGVLVSYVPESALTAPQAKLERYERMEAAMRGDLECLEKLIEEEHPDDDLTLDFRAKALERVTYLRFLDQPQEPNDANA